eukprot:12854838-Ditylum_brightwellii.AAC.1
MQSLIASVTKFATFEEDYDTDGFSSTKSKKGGKHKNMEINKCQSSCCAEEGFHERTMASTVDDMK